MLTTMTLAGAIYLVGGVAIVLLLIIFLLYSSLLDGRIDVLLTSCFPLEASEHARVFASWSYPVHRLVLHPPLSLSYGSSCRAPLVVALV